MKKLKRMVVSIFAVWTYLLMSPLSGICCTKANTIQIKKPEVLGNYQPTTLIRVTESTRDGAATPFEIEVHNGSPVHLTPELSPMTSEGGISNTFSSMSLSDEAELPKLRILVVEDLIAIQKVLTRILEHRHHHHVEIAPTGEVAVKRLNEVQNDSEQSFHMIFMDYDLGSGMTGADVTREIRSQGQTIIQPYILGYSSDMAFNISLEAAGANLSLHKPARNEQIMSKVHFVQSQLKQISE